MPVNPDRLLEVLCSSGKYSVTDEINEGVNARAFVATQMHLQRKIFLKIYDYIESEFVSSLKEPRLLVEATSTEPLCENLVRVFDAEVIDVDGDKFLCLQMELVQGKSVLGELQGGPLGQQTAVRLARGICQGVGHLHALDLVHRDLKPSNVVVEAGIPKIADFGSVTKIAAGSDRTTGSMHSVLYVPPEGLVKPSTFYKKSDVYQVGMVLYEMINGAMVYDAEHYISQRTLTRLQKAGSPYQAMDGFDKTALQNAEIRALALKRALLEHGSPRRPYFSPVVRRIVRAAIAPDPERRPSIAELEYELSRVSVPDWRPVPDDRIEAESWQGWDWAVLSDGEILRSRPGSGQYRRYSQLGTASSFASAVKLVDSYRQ